MDAVWVQAARAPTRATITPHNPVPAFILSFNSNRYLVTIRIRAAPGHSGLEADGPRTPSERDPGRPPGGVDMSGFRRLR